MQDLTPSVDTVGEAGMVQKMKSRGWVRLKATNFWQAVFVRPFPSGKDRWKARFASLLSYVVGIFLLIPLMGASLVNDYMTSATPLEQMHKVTGVLVSVTICHRCPQLFGTKGVSFAFLSENPPCPVARALS